MIQKQAIESIYKKCRRCPASADELNIPLLFEQIPDSVDIQIENCDIIIGSIDAASPFHRIPIGHIHAILDFDESVAIVLHSSIVFISKHDGTVYVHIKELGLSIIDRIRNIMGIAAM